MKWICKKCGDNMESKTAFVVSLQRRYIANCTCTEEFPTDVEVKEFQKKNWMLLNENVHRNARTGKGNFC